MSEADKTEKVDPPTAAELVETRAKIHADHLDYFYGDYWCIFVDKTKKCFLEFDIGHFDSNFITREISQRDYDSLKRDKSTFTKISRRVDPRYLSQQPSNSMWRAILLWKLTVSILASFVVGGVCVSQPWRKQYDFADSAWWIGIGAFFLVLAIIQIGVVFLLTKKKKFADK